MTITGSISAASLQSFKPKSGLVDLSNRIPKEFSLGQIDKAQDPELRLKQWQEQINTPQNTVFEFRGKIVATIGDNGFKFFARNSDSTTLDMEQALRSKYGSALEVHRFDIGQGPTAGDIHKRMHGYLPQPPVTINTSA